MILTILCSFALLFPQRAPETGATAPAQVDTRDLASILADVPDKGFLPPSPDWELDLPSDHAAHRDARMESWQVIAHLQTMEGDALGFQFSLLRLGIGQTATVGSGSVWDPKAVFRGYAGLVGLDAGPGVGDERFARSIPRLAGYDAETRELRLDDWVLQFADKNKSGTITLYATLGDSTQVTLALKPEKPVLPFEPDGADAPFVGYAMTRMEITGTITSDTGTHTVNGTGWLDHTWGELPVPGTGPVSWDRLQYHLSDGSDGMILRARRSDGRGTPSLNGVMIDPSGTAAGFDETVASMTATRQWQHAQSGAEYPVAWSVTGPGFDMTLTPLVDGQRQAFSIPMWNGVVRISGTRNGTPVTGMGTLQLTGYEGG